MNSPAEHTLNDADARRLRTFIRKHGEVATAQLLGMSRSTVLRALAQQPQRLATCAYIATKLEQLAREDVAAEAG